MLIYKNQNVFDAALERVNYLFDEFPNVVVSVSGGKDSTIVLQLALRIAEERNRLPVTVMFLDQESEWSFTIDYIRSVMYDPRVNPLWMQIPFRLENSTSSDEIWLNCWDESKKSLWIHPQDPISRKENIYGEDMFVKLLCKITDTEFRDSKTAVLMGIRAEESPARTLGITSNLTYKAITWGRIVNKKLEHFNFFPIYDWSYTDVWKAIHDNKWPYAQLYDYHYQYGVKPIDMRLSSLHHETAVKNLFFMQEIDAEVWGRMTRRMKGINTAGQLKESSITTPKKLPYMFESWCEYRDYLCENLVSNHELKSEFRKKFIEGDKLYTHKLIKDVWAKNCITGILASNAKTKLDNFRVRPEVAGYLKYLKGKRHKADNGNKYIKEVISERTANKQCLLG